MPVSQSRNYRVGLCLVASLKIRVIFFTKSLVSYGVQDMLNILLCKNHVACFCRHPPECFPVFKSNVFVPSCPVPTHTSWDKRVRMSPELQPNLKIFKKFDDPLLLNDSTLPIEFHSHMFEIRKKA